MGQFGDVRVAEDFELRLRPAFTQCANRRQRANEITNRPAANDEDARSFQMASKVSNSEVSAPSSRMVKPSCMSVTAFISEDWPVLSKVTR